MVKCKALYKIVASCIENGVFPLNWKMVNVTPIHKKESVQLVQNYRLALLLPNCGTFFACLMYNKMFTHFIDLKVSESRYRQYGLTPHFSTGQNLLKKILRKDKIDQVLSKLIHVCINLLQ